MDWPRVKTILIVFFLIINLLLLGILGFRTNQDKITRIESDKKLTDLLLKKGLDIGTVEIPGIQEYTYDIFRDTSTEMAAAEALLGRILKYEVEGNTHNYMCENGSASFRTTGYSEISLSQPITINTANSKDEALALANNIKIVTTETYGAAYSSIQQTENSIILYLFVRNLPIWDSYAEFTIYNEAITKISGRWLFGTPQISSDTLCISAETALLLLANSGMELGKLKNISLGFHIFSISPVAVRLIPSWYIEFNASGYYVNAMTNEISSG